MVDEDAFVSLAKAQERTLYRIAFSILSNDQDCLDAVQNLEALKNQEEVPMKQKSISAILLTALLIIALACTALAVGSRLGILDALEHYRPESGEDPSPYVITDIAQTGGDLELVTFTVTEAIYTGYSLHFNVLATPKEDGIALRGMEEADGADGVLAVFCDADLVVDGTELDAYWGNGYSFGCFMDPKDDAYAFTFYAAFPSGVTPPDTLTVECYAGYAESSDANGRGERVREAVRFEVSKTGALELRDVCLDVNVHGVQLTRLTLIRTPIELVLQMEGISHEIPLWRDIYKFAPQMEGGSPPGLTIKSLLLIDADGQRVPMHHSGVVSDGLGGHSINGIWTAGTSMPDEITLWVSDTNTALVINTNTGESALHPADILSDGRIIVHYEETL